MTPEDKMRELLGRAEPSEVATEQEWNQFRGRAHRSLAVRRGAIAAIAVVLLAAGIAAGAVLTNGPIAAPEPIAPAGTPTATPEPEPTAVETMVLEPTFPYPSGDADPSSVVQVYFVGETSGKLSPTYRLVDDPVAIANRAMAALLAGPSGPDQEAGDTSVIPQGTRLLGLTIEDGVATVDLSEEFDDSNVGSGYAHLPLAQVVWTLTQFDTVGSVAFEIEGEPISSYGSHGVVIDGPQKRKDYEDDAPPIIVDFPFPGQQVDTTFVLEGTANVFEANVSYRVVAANGDVLAEGFSTATCGTGCRGHYSETIDLFVEGPTDATLEVFESSAEDGSPLHMVEVPIFTEP